MRSYIHGGIGFAEFNTGLGVVSYINTSASAGDKVTTVQVEVKDKVGTVASWGKNNDYPQKIMEAVRKNGSASRGLSFNRKAHYGNGLTLLNIDVTDDGKHDPRVIPIASQPLIRDFFTKSQMPRFWKETIMDLEWWGIAFPEYILSNDYTQINRVKRQKAAWCRFEVMNPDNGLVENVYISEKFGKTSVSTDSNWVSKIALIDSYWSPEEVKEYCKRNKIHNFIRPVFYPLLDEAYYPEAEWHAAYKSGWLDIANSVPEWVLNMFKNQVSIKYHIEIDERYYINVFKDQWQNFTNDERRQQRENTLDKINEHLSKPENAGKSLQTMMYKDEQSGEQVSFVKISVIDDKYKDGVYLPTAEAANSEILFPIGVDASLIGVGIPGSKLGAGSGSDKNAAFNIVNALLKTNRETTLEVFDFIRDYNGWDPTITGAFENTILTTLDKNPTGSQKVAN
jgi:hypothetical protein